MDRLARTVAARWALEQALGDWQPEIPGWVVKWSSQLFGRVAFVPEHDEDLEVFRLARESVNLLLSKLLDTFRAKFKERFYMNVSQSGNRAYYFFSGHPALETIALNVMVRGGKTTLSMVHIPHDLHGRADMTKSTHQTVVVEDPEMAGLALMRLARSLLAKV